MRSSKRCFVSADIANRLCELGNLNQGGKMYKSIRDLHPLFYLRRLRIFQAVTGPLERLLDFPVFVSLKGMNYPICVRFWPNISILLGRAGALEVAERANFCRLVRDRKAGVFWDVGANIGSYSVDFLSANAGGQVVALEPDGANADALRRTTDRSKLAICVLELAAYDSEGFLPFYFDDMTGTTGSLTTIGGTTFNKRHFGVTPREGRVRTVTLDSLLTKYPPPDIVKIDVEGAELSVLTGAASLLRDVRPVLLMELGTHHAEIGALLADAGYRLVDAKTLGGLTGDSWNVFALPM